MLAPVLAPHAIDDRFGDLPNAPPTRPHIVDDRGDVHAPFIYRIVLINRLEQTYEEQRYARVPLVWFSRGRLV
ncbi:MAG TPA: hypothetical protein VGY57_15575, partial [Vicinamibacterales bacterium]|nr:hypothetical protein [Vicinamibacterales bacterium]